MFGWARRSVHGGRERMPRWTMLSIVMDDTCNKPRDLQTRVVWYGMTVGAKTLTQDTAF